MVRFYLETDRVADLVTHLLARKPVYAPQRKGRKSFAFEKVERAADVVLDYPRTLNSVKKFFLPSQETLLDFSLTDNSCTQPTVVPTDAVFLGVHAYDVRAVQRLDHNFAKGHAEKNYLTRRQGAVFIGVSFTPDEFHFSSSVGIDPHDPEGCDVFLHAVDGGYAVDVLTVAGEALLEGFELPLREDVKFRPAVFDQYIYVPQSKLSEVMAGSYDHPVWQEEAERCVACGTCNLVCPTCYCFDVEDTVNIQATGGTRERHWDGCMLRSFTAVAGGEVFREHLAGRQRHRVFRKFKYISDETGEPWCVGCGRCTANCTAGISIVNIVNRLVNDHGNVTA